MNERRFLALLLLIALAARLATWHGQQMRHLRMDHYAGRLQDH